jgi:hypothetical protein
MNRSAPASTATTAPLEAAVLAAFPYLVGGLLVALPLLLVPGSWDVFATFVIQLAGLVLLGLVVAAQLLSFTTASWYRFTGWSERAKRLAGDVSLVVVVTGLIGLVTLATSAALRLEPSLQFLQLLSALDIAWAGAAIMIGAYRLWGRGAATVGGGLLGVFCVWSIWNYLRIGGFTAAGGWLVEGDQVMRLVLPFDMMAAAVAIALLVIGSGRAGPPSHRTVQASDQS